MIGRCAAARAIILLAAFPALADSQPSVTPQFSHALPNAQGKAMNVVTVNLPPGAASAPHRHGQAFVYAYVLSGRVRTQVEGEPEKVLGPGQSWFEMPGAHHLVSANASKTEPASFLAVLIADEGAPLVVPDGQAKKP